MKKLIIILQCGLFILLASFNAGAQNVPEAKPIKPDDAMKPAAKNSAVMNDKDLVKPVVVLPLQKAETPTTVAPKEPIIQKPAEQKTFDSRQNSNANKGVAQQNIEVPKTSTLTGLKNGDPIQLPVQPEKPMQPLKQKE